MTFARLYIACALEKKVSSAQACGRLQSESKKGRTDCISCPDAGGLAPVLADIAQYIGRVVRPLGHRDDVRLARSIGRPHRPKIRTWAKQKRPRVGVSALAVRYAGPHPAAWWPRWRHLRIIAGSGVGCAAEHRCAPRVPLIRVTGAARSELFSHGLEARLLQLPWSRWNSLIVILLAQARSSRYTSAWRIKRSLTSDNTYRTKRRQTLPRRIEPTNSAMARLSRLHLAPQAPARGLGQKYFLPCMET